MTPVRRVSLATVVVVVAACGSCAPTDEGVVARAADQSWTVEEAATLVAPHAALPADPEVVRATANLWIDYTMLATAALEDSTLAQLDVSPLVNDLARQQLIAALRDSVIHVEPMTADELRRLYREQAPGSMVRARQISLSLPENATGEQRDSVRRAIEAVRARIVDGGEDIAAVAASVLAPAGGSAGVTDLGVVRRGQLQHSLDSTLFALEPGAVSAPVASPFGFHLFQVQERLTPSPEQFRGFLLGRREAAAESSFVATLESRVHPEIADDAEERVRELARNFRQQLSGREQNRPLLRYDGGAVTQEEVLWYFQSQPPLVRQQVAASRDSTLPDRTLRAVAHSELLALEALRRGWTTPAELRERAAASARRNLADAARQLGLMNVHVDPGQAPADAVHDAVSDLLANMLTGARREVTPLGVMSYILRRHYRGGVVEDGVNEAVARVRAAREGTAPATETGEGSPSPSNAGEDSVEAVEPDM